MKQKRYSIGYIYYKESVDNIDKLLISTLGRRLDVVLLPVEEQLDPISFKKKVKSCKVILNYAAAGPELQESVELSKTLEELGKRVVSPTHSFYYQEDKWMFYLKCIENGIPTPRTYFIPRDLKSNNPFIRNLLKKQPLVIKAVFSDNGVCVERAATPKDFFKKLSKILRRNPVSPVLAQEYIPSDHRSYRVTLINYKVKQAVGKLGGRSWKQTGSSHKEHFMLARIGKRLKALCEQTSRVCGLEVCGLDLIYAQNRWYIIEANSCPDLFFINHDAPRLARLLVSYLYGICRKLG